MRMPPSSCSMCPHHLLIVLLLLLPLAAPQPCPRSCSCPQPTELHCTFRSLPSIPAAVSRKVERINLGFNSIHAITGRSLAGMRRLEILMIHGNDIHSIPDGAFRDLQSLQMLKMSYNKLKEISRHTLQGLWALSRLHLDHNRLEFIHADAFQGLTSLKLLQLEGNSLQQLHPETFTTFTLMGHLQVSTLRNLYLSDNALVSLPSRLMETMPQLEHLYLHGNPWSCDCGMKWLQDWDQTSPGVLKCKKDRALPGGQLCPVCSSPRNMQRKQLQSVKNLACSSPIISSPYRISPHEDMDSEVLTIEDFREPFGNISLGLSDEHGNEVALDCSIGQPMEFSGISWEQINQLQLESNVSFAVHLECSVDREKYEQLWRLIAYYSSVPAHLQRERMLASEPHPTYVFRQDSEKDALYYTGVKAHIKAQAAWLMQSSLDLQLNRAQSSSKTVKLILRTSLSENVDVELSRRQRRSWVMIESTNTTREVFSSILGGPLQMDCHVHSSGRPAIQWKLPDGSKLEAENSSPDKRVSVSTDGQLLIKSVAHKDTGHYYCVAKVGGDVAIMPFFLTVQDSSSPPPGEQSTLKPIEQTSGNPISLPCNASGSPDAEISWILPSSSIITLRANSSRALLYPNGTLHIQKAQIMDSGYYKCVAMNQHGVDTLATKVSVERGGGLLRPLRRIPARPQSASGVNTKIKVPIEDIEEASGDAEINQERASKGQLDPLRRRIPGGVAPGRRRLHPLSNIRPRPPVVRKPTGSNAEDRRDIVESRRRINVSKSRIDPEKWADILAKIRERKTQTVATPAAVQLTTVRTHTEPTFRPQENIEGSSEGAAVQDQEGQKDPPTTHTPVEHTHWHHESEATQSSQDMTSQTHGTHEPHATQSPHDALQATLTEDLELQVLPRTTSAPSHTLSPTPASTNTASSSSRPFSLRENLGSNTDADGGEASDGSNTAESENVDDPNGVSPGPAADRELSVSGVPISRPNKSDASQEENGKYLIESLTSPPVTPSTLDNFQSPVIITTASPMTSSASTGRRRGSKGQSHPDTSRRRNGGRRRRPNGRRQKQNKPQWIATTVRAVASSPPSLELVDATTANFQVTAPFSSGQVTSSVGLSHKEHTEFRHDDEAAVSTSSAPALSYTTKAVPPPLDQPPIAGTTTMAPLSSHGSPDAGQRNGSSQTVVGISERASPSVSQQMVTSTQLPSVTIIQETHSTAALEFGTLPDSDGSSEGPLTTTQSDHWDTLDSIKMDEEMGRNSLEMSFPPRNEMEATTEHNTPSTSTTSSRSDPMFSSTTALDVTQSTPGSEPTPPLQPTTTEAAHGGSSSPPLHPGTTSKPGGPSDLHPETQSSAPTAAPSTSTGPTSPALEVSSGQTTEQMTTPDTTTTAAQSSPTTQGLVTTTQHVSREQQLPGQRAPSRVTPRIVRSNITRVTVNAERDAQLPCEAVGDPAPFLSWTKVANGASIAQNTRVQRFEVHQNGTLIIRNAQLADGGQYRCIVQNQYGTDQILLNLVVLAQPPQAPHPQYRDVTVHLGANIDLECKVDGRPVSRVTWVLPSQAHIAASPLGIASQQHVAVLTNGTLRIHQARYTDMGVYKCITSSPAGVKTLSVQLSIAALPPVIQQTHHENQTLTEGSAAYIHCSATGAPQPAIRWTTPDGTQLMASQFVMKDNVVVFPNGTLYMPKVGAGNTGRYECLASNGVASSGRVVYLKVIRSPSSAKAVITASSPRSKDVIYGGRLLLNCVASGQPEPWIMWRTPTKKLVDSQYSFDPRIQVFPNGTISVHSVTNKDAGEYLCAARNKMGDDYVVLRVNVLTRPAKIEQKQQPSSQEVIYGGDLKVDCVASGLPNPEISWVLPDGTMVNPDKRREGVGGGRSRRYVLFDNGTLYFNDVGMREEGDYTCYAENQLGKDEMRVRVKIKVSTSVPQIQDKDRSQLQVFLGEKVSLRCNAKGEPTPLITWISPTNRVISPSFDKYQVLSDGTLVVQKVQRFDSGNYTCVARNRAGEDRKVTRLEVLVTPPMINGLRGTDNAVKVVTVQDQRELMDCFAQGNPTPRILWVLPGNVVLPAPYNSNRMRVHQNGTLEIRSPKKADSGQIVCIARNEGGEVRLVVNLEVKELVGRPQIRGPITDNLSLTVGHTMTLNCSSEGVMLPQVTWVLPSGTPLKSGTRSSKFLNRHDGSLIISNPSIAEAGTYRCLSHASGGRVERVVVLSPGKKPDIVSRYTSPVSLMIGETLLLHCLTNHEPLRLTWNLPSGVVLNRPQRAGRYAVLANGTLAVQQVSVYDRGAYVCRATNEYGSSALSVSVSVIAYPPRITSSPPSVTYAKRGVAVQLNCIASGIPKVDVAWETPDKTRLAVGTQPRLFGNKYLHPEGALIIQNPSLRDAGFYRCVARNSIGVDSKSTMLNVF